MTDIPCKYGVMESQSHPYGMGSATETWFDCAHPDNCPEGQEDLWDCETGKCPGYEPLDVLVCARHGKEYFEGDCCGECEAEEYQRDKELADDYWQDQADYFKKIARGE